MDNQHRHITGYRELNEGEILMMNGIKETGVVVGNLVEQLAKMDGADQRWVSIARTQLQQGFMALTRAIAKPTTF